MWSNGRFVWVYVCVCSRYQVRQGKRLIILGVHFIKSVIAYIRDRQNAS